MTHHHRTPLWNAIGVTNKLNSFQQDIMTIGSKFDETANNFSSVLNTLTIFNEAMQTNVDSNEAISASI